MWWKKCTLNIFKFHTECQLHSDIGIWPKVDQYLLVQGCSNYGSQPDVWWVMGWVLPSVLVSGWLQTVALWTQLEAFQSPKVTSGLLPGLLK